MNPTIHNRNRGLSPIFLLLTLMFGIAALAFAEEEEEEGEDRGAPFNIQNTVYREECGSCHVPYPPELLSSQSWFALMSNLDDHFGANASMDVNTARQVSEFLLTNGGRRLTVDNAGQPLRRISETNWFKDAHRPGHDGLRKGVFESDAVKSAANCEACHRNAAEGDFSEDSIHIPK